MRKFLLGLVSLCGVLGLSVVMSATAQAAIITVDSTGDGANVGPGCDDGLGSCTLRAAIEFANATAGADVIEFAIAGAGVHTITPGSALPIITEQLEINGETQPGSSCGDLVPASLPAVSNTPHTLNIEIDGTIGSPLTLSSTAGSSILRGMNLHSGAGNYSVMVDNNSSSTVECNYIGTNPSGSAVALSPADAGITSNGTVTDLTIQNNLISGNDFNGVFLNGTGIISGNLIGTDAAGTAAIPNSGSAISGYYNTTGLTIDTNIISGNTAWGIDTDGVGSQIDVPSYIITNNYIGVDLTGAALGNTGSGIDIRYVESATISGNTISNNTLTGIQILEGHTISVTTNTITNNSQGVNLDSAGTITDSVIFNSNIVSLNGASGGVLIASETTTAIGNSITGTAGSGDGLNISGATVSLTVTSNTATGNGGTGILAVGTGQVNDNTASSNSINGLFVAGDIEAFDNTTNTNLASGMVVSGTSPNVHDNMMDGNFTGMTLTADIGTVNHNTMINSDADGIDILGGSDSTVTNNYVGVMMDGTIASNALDGVFVQGTTSVTIGGTSAATRNYISGNTNNGIHLFACGTNITTGVTIIGNYIGTNLSGAIQAGYGNGGSGIVGNEQDLIGCGGGGGGGGGSLYVNVIGGDAAGEPNVIAGNDRDGIRFFQAPGMDVFSNTVLPNQIFGNTNLGINLAADSGNTGMADLDVGPNVINAFLMSLPATNANYYLNHPIINSSTFSGDQLTVNYSFTANQADNATLQQSDVIGYRLDFYLNDNAQDGAYAGYNQAKTHLGYFVVDGSETNATHTFTAPTVLSTSQSVNVTATVLWNISAPPP